MKYKLLLADDEYLVRMGIRETIDWASLDIEVVGEAANGEKGLEAARALKPDLIISDVRMPVMDGLEMAKTLLDEGADLAVIIYSGYKDFEYARRALDSEVSAYLLKPVDNAQLVEKVKEALAKLDAKRSKSKVFDLLEIGAPYLKSRLFESWLTAEEDGAEMREKLRLVDITPVEEGRILYCTASGTDAEAELSSLCVRIAEELEGFENEWDVSGGAFVFVTSLRDASVLVNHIRQLFVELSKKSDARFKLCVSRPFGTDYKRRRAYLEVTALCGNMPYSAVNTVSVAGENATYFKKLVQDALSVIEKEYDKKLSVRMVADKLYVSESHLMHEFKDNVGKTFNECLTDYRMTKAKELLLKGSYRVNEVATKVGYTDVKYFGQVFKETTGLTPSEFVAEHSRGGGVNF